jgi:CRISPR type III-A-associated RAMP protein Csm4
LYRSDRLYSALCLAMRQLGFLDEWLGETALAAKPAVAFTSLFPYQGDTLFAVPPVSLWPPPAALVSAPTPGSRRRIRWEGARFVPLRVIELLVNGESISADQWSPDTESGCLLHRDRSGSGPFRRVKRGGAAVDRLTGRAAAIEPLACVEFEPGSGLWSAARYRDSAAESNWSSRVQGAFRLLADTGFGGRRVSGWGQTEAPHFEEGTWPGLLMPKLGQASEAAEASLYWLLSVYSPCSSDRIAWDDGNYQLAVRGGRIESAAAFGAQKKSLRMISEGSVLEAESEPIGAAVNVAPEEFSHPVYRSGLAVTVKLPASASRASEDASA